MIDDPTRAESVNEAHAGGQAASESSDAMSLRNWTESPLAEKEAEAGRIAAWLRSLPRMSAVRPLLLTIRGLEYSGARAIQAHGGIRGGIVSEADMFYLVGPLPPIRVRRHCAFVAAGEPCEFYVSAYWPEIVHKRQLEGWPSALHPFGPHFMLAAWPVTDAPIDRWEKSRYLRVPIEINYL